MWKRRESELSSTFLWSHRLPRRPLHRVPRPKFPADSLPLSTMRSEGDGRQRRGPHSRRFFVFSVNRLTRSTVETYRSKLTCVRFCQSSLCELIIKNSYWEVTVRLIYFPVTETSETTQTHFPHNTTAVEDHLPKRTVSYIESVSNKVKWRRHERRGVNHLVLYDE